MEKTLKYSKFKSFLNYLKPNNQKDTGFELMFGSRGVGKTTYMAKLYYSWLLGKVKRKKDTHVNFYSNVQFNLITKDYHLLDLSKFTLTDYLPNSGICSKYHCHTSQKFGSPDFFIKPDSIIMIDEIGILFHSRNYKSMPQELINFTKIIRKYNCLFICCSQQYDIDKALRQTASSLRLMTKFGHFNINRKIKKYIDINNSDDSSAEQQIVDKVQFCSIFEPDAIRLTFIPFWTDLFDSFG